MKKAKEANGPKLQKISRNEEIERRRFEYIIFELCLYLNGDFFSPLLHSCCTTQISSCACHLCVLFRISFDFRCSSASIASIRLFIRWLLFGVFGANKYSNKCHFGLSFAVCGRMGFWIVRLCDCGCDYRVLFATVFSIYRGAISSWTHVMWCVTVSIYTRSYTIKIIRHKLRFFFIQNDAPRIMRCIQLFAVHRKAIVLTDPNSNEQRRRQQNTHTARQTHTSRYNTIQSDRERFWNIRRQCFALPRLNGNNVTYGATWRDYNNKIYPFWSKCVRERRQ